MMRVNIITTHRICFVPFAKNSGSIATRASTASMGAQMLKHQPIRIMTAENKMK